VENLERLTKLERLWLCNNAIPRIEGLETLTNLTELNLARNKIERVGDVFKANPMLTSLNIADNGVGSFKEVSYLARLPTLKDLSLSDPHWGENPITSLCNYQTYVLFNIQQLTSLDTLVLAEETKQLAEATYMKKRMYYNMRIKTLRRNTTNALRRAQEGSSSKVAKANTQLSTLIRHLKEVEREIEDIQFYERPGQVRPFPASWERSSNPLVGR
jgi:Leucine-rich repeat (LRR) protein